MPHAANGESLYTIQRTAAILDCHRSHVYHLIADGELETVNIARHAATRSTTRVLRSSVDAYLARRRNAAADCAAS